MKASKCLSSCLVKSFESNYNLIYIISSFENSKLNYLFGSLEEKQTEFLQENNLLYSKNCEEIEKKILSYANNSIYSYKILFQHMSNPKENKLDGINLKNYILYINLSSILNLLNKGKLLLGFTKFKYLLENEILMKSANYEIIEIILNISLDMLDYDIDNSLEYFFLFYKRNQNSNKSQIKNNSFNYLVKMIKIKLYGLSQNDIFLKNSNFANDEKICQNLYYKNYIKYIKYFTNIKSLTFKNQVCLNMINILKLKKFIKKLKNQKILKLYFKSKLYLAKLFALEDLNKAKLIAMKIKDKNLDDGLLLRYYLFECFLNSRTKNFKKLKEFLNIIERSFILKNSGSIEDKYEFYYFKMELLSYKLNKNNSKIFCFYELFSIWIYLLILSIKLMNNEKTFFLLSLLIKNFDLNIENLKIILNNKMNESCTLELKIPESKYFDFNRNKNFTNIYSNIMLKDIFKVLDIKFKGRLFELINSHIVYNGKLLSIIENSLLDSEEEIELIYIIKEHNERFAEKLYKFMEDN